jgi:hypothetical protein
MTNLSYHLFLVQEIELQAQKIINLQDVFTEYVVTKS